MPIGRKKPRFQIFARVTGTMDWTCPYCGLLQKASIPLLCFRVQCEGRECRRKLAFGLRFFELPGGGRIETPHDMLTHKYSGVLPPAEFASRRYRSGQNVHQFWQEEGSKAAVAAEP